MISYEDLMCEADGFGLPASPAQRAKYRIRVGEPLGDLATHPDVISMVGGPEAIAQLLLQQGHIPQLFVDIAAVRTAKTLGAVGAGLHASQTADVTGVRPGEVPRVVIVSLTLDHARAAFSHLLGTLQARPALRKLIVGKPTADSVTVRHPSGRPIELRVVAQGEAGSAVVARWIVALIIDEAPRMNFEGAARIQDLISAARGRLLPGGQILAIGSPWAPAGPIYDYFTQSFARPTPDLVVLWGTGPMLNPTWWTPERCERLRTQDPITYATDVEGKFVDADVSLFSPEMLQRAQRAELVRFPPKPTRWLPPPQVGAAIDLGSGRAGRNASTLAITFLEHYSDTAGIDRERLVVATAREWRGMVDEPLSFRSFFYQVSDVLSPFGITDVWADQWSFDAAREIADSIGLRLRLRESSDVTEMWANLSRFVREPGAFEIPPDVQVIRDLQGVRQRATPTGFRVTLATPPDGRHCDYAPAIALAAMHCTRHVPSDGSMGQNRLFPF